MIELLLRACICKLPEGRVVQQREALVCISHPQMRHVAADLVDARIGPMMQIGGNHESRRAGFLGGELALLPFVARKVTGHAIDPFAGLGWSEANDHAPSAV